MSRLRVTWQSFPLVKATDAVEVGKPVLLAG
jgi:hypothetical protein